MITRFLNNDYVLSKVMSFLSTILALLGFTSCGDKITEVEMPLGVLCAYGCPTPFARVRGELTGLVTDSVGNPIENISVSVYPVTQNGKSWNEFNSFGLTGEDGKYTTPFKYNIYVGDVDDSTFVRDYFPSYMAIATDKTGVYENDTLYIDYVLYVDNVLYKSDEDKDFYYSSSATADFVLRKKKNQ